MVLIILLLITLLSNFTLAEEHPLGVSGYVKDSSDNPVAGATVTVTNLNNSETNTATTNNQGLYATSVPGDTGDIITVTAEHNGLTGSNTTTADATKTTQWVNISIGAELVARFTYYPEHPSPGEKITFVDLSTGDIDTWEWNFGDGSTALGKHQTHVYDEEGTYTVKLKIYSGSLTDTARKTIKVEIKNPEIPPVKPPTYPEGYTVEEMYTLLKALNLPDTTNKITIVTIDSGVVPRTYNGIDLSKIQVMATSAFSTGIDNYGHGTFVAYEIAFMLQNKMPNAVQISIKTFDKDGKTTPAIFLQALDIAKQLKPDVISISAGAIGNPDDVYSQKIKQLRREGIIVISCAAGNLGPNPSTILSPAVSKDAVAVGASDPQRTITDLTDDTICTWSSRGPVPVNEPKPDVTAPGESIRGPWLNEERVASGTSLSTPLIAGGSALIIANHKPVIDILKIIYFWNKGVISDAFESALEEGCYKKGDQNAWGAGIVQFDKVDEIFAWKLAILLIIPIIIIIIILFVVGVYLHHRIVEKKELWW